MENQQTEQAPSGNPELDYSAIPTPSANVDDGWEAPRHVFFGKKLPDGKLEKEPAYKFEAYPSVVYAQPGGPGTRIVTKMLYSEADRALLGPGWESTAAKFGYIGAPSFEDHLRLNGSPAQAMADEQAKRDAEALQAAQAAAKVEAEARAKADAEAVEAALQARIDAAVAAALAKVGEEKRGPGRPRNES
jgi:hypothetical protein